MTRSIDYSVPHESQFFEFLSREEASKYANDANGGGVTFPNSYFEDIERFTLNMHLIKDMTEEYCY